MTAYTLNEVTAMLPDWLGGVHSARVELEQSFVDTVRRFAHLPGTVALLSGGQSDCARYNILGIAPWLTLRGSTSELSVECNGHSSLVSAQPLAVLRHVLRRYTTTQPPGSPICAGMLGYLSYDLKDCIEVLPRTSVDDLKLPALYLVAPSLLLVEDLVTRQTFVHLPILSSDDAALKLLKDFEHQLASASPPPNNAELRGAALKSGFTCSAYESAVDAIRDYIVRGHVYQVNMSQRFAADFQGDPFELFVRLFSRNPAPFFGYINAGDHQIVSTSPERFIQMSGKALETRPIKGTRPRGKTPDEDARLRFELETSRKDDAELSMIVDLLRNDLGKVCRAGSVRVSQHKRLETYENVFHLVSLVNGERDDDKDAVDVIEATFPGGSITGCPKIRAMEVIDELEPVRRHIYTGSIGYLSFHETMDLSIAIRTATVTDGRLLFSVGGGVVYDSDPREEFNETLHKGRTLMQAFDEALPIPERVPGVAWYNGSYQPLAAACVPVLDEGFSYGYGIFETIRVHQGKISMLEEHLARFERSWRYCFDTSPPDITWKEVISQVVSRSGLDDKTAAVKLLATAGHPGSRQPDGTLLVTAREYIPRNPANAPKGLRLKVYPHRRHTHLADHKTMNYMFYRLATQWAKQAGADDAIILNADGSVSETGIANILVVVGEQVYRLESEHALCGIMESAVCSLLERWGTSVQSRRLGVAELQAADRVFVTNSLMGVLPVEQIGEATFELNHDLCCRVNGALLAS